MRQGNSILNKIVSKEDLSKRIAQWRLLGKTIAFTNGCFDIIHGGHIASLSEAAKHADFLIVGINSDSSVKGLKGNDRPVNGENSRAMIMASLLMVDAVIIFSEETPKDLIVSIKPDFLVKGGDYTVDQIAGAKEVIENGGQVIINTTLPGFSTTSIVNKLRQ